MKIKLIIKRTIIIVLCIVHSNSTSFAMMTTGSRLVPQYARTAAPALGVAGSQFLNTMSGQPNVNTTYNPQVKNYIAQSTSPDYTKKASDYPAFDQNKVMNNQQPQPQVDMKKAFEYADSYDVNAQDNLQPQINNNPNDQPQQPAFNPNISIAQNLYGKKPAAPNSSPFAQQQRSYSTFRPKSNDPYDILGVSRNATPEQIKEAHRKLVKEYHPDLNQNNKAEATKALQQINDAYDKLTKPNEQYSANNQNNDQYNEYQNRSKQKSMTIDEAITKHDINAVKDLIRRGEINFDRFDQNGDTWLIKAIKKCSTKSIQTFMFFGQQSKIEEKEEPQYQIVKALLAAGSMVNAPNKQGQTPLFVAIIEGKLDAINLLKSIRGATAGDLNQPDKNGITLLMQAFREGKSYRAKALIENGADITRKDKDGNTALHYAIQNYYNLEENYLSGYRVGYDELLDAYVEQNISFYEANKKGRSPYDEAGELSSISNRSAAHELRNAIDQQEKKGFKPSKPMSMYAKKFASGVGDAASASARVGGNIAYGVANLTGEILRRSVNWKRTSYSSKNERTYNGKTYVYSYSFRIPMWPIIIASIVYYLTNQNIETLNPLIDKINELDPSYNLNQLQLSYSHAFIQELAHHAHSPEAIIKNLEHEKIIQYASVRKIGSYYQISDDATYITLEDMHHTINALYSTIALDNESELEKKIGNPELIQKLRTLKQSLKAIKNQLEHILSFAQLENDTDNNQ